MSQQINLFNPIFLKKKKYFSATTMTQALGLILLGCVALNVFAGYQLSKLEKEAKVAGAQLAQVQAQLNEVNASYGTRQKTQSLEEDVQQMEAEVRILQQVSGILKEGELGDSKSYAEHMRAFSRQIVSGVWLTAFSIDSAGNQVGLRGRALQPELVPMYINRLKQEPVMKGKSFATLEMQAPLDEQAGKADAAAHGSRRFAPYIEFSLQSSAAADASVDMPGAKGK